jgi:transcriptional regulator with XRE-family HTH domain
VLSNRRIGEHARVPVCKDKACPHRIRLGRNLAKLRKRKELTQERVAEKMEVSARYIQNLEAGDNFPTLPILAQLKGILHCSWDELFEGCERISK